MKSKIAAIFMAVLIVTLPVSFAISIQPSSVEAVDITDTSATIQWETTALGEGWVNYGLDGNVKKGPIPETNTPMVQFDVLLQGLSSGQRYYYKVTSEDYYGTDSVGPKEFTTRLSAPTGLKTTDVGNTEIDLAWNSDSKATKYKVFKDGSYLAQSTTNSYTVTGLAPETSYSFEVVSVDSLGRDSEKSSALSVTTSVQEVVISFVMASSITENSAVISWETDQSVACSVNYDKDTSLDQTKTETQAKTTHSITLTGLDSNTRYYYQISCGTVESNRQSFNTLAGAAELEISNVQVSQVTSSSARITWETNKPADTEVLYSTDDSFNLRKSGTGDVMNHVVDLDSLDAETTYYFKAKSDSVESAYQTFTTIGSTADFIRLDPTPGLTSNRTITVSGTTRQDARVYIFVNEDSEAQVRKTITGTQFSYSVQLDPSKRYDGVAGKNYVEVSSWDLQGNKDTKSFYVVLDITPPELTVKELPDITVDTRLKVTGTTESNGKVEFFINDNSQGEASAGDDGTFKKDINLGADGDYVLKVVAKDEAGNEKIFSHKITVDRTKPKLEILTELRGVTHFKIIKIKGKTDPNAEVTVTNFGPYTGCKDPKLKKDYGSCKEFIYKQDKYDQFIGLYDIVSYGMGMEVTTDADSDGDFSVSISLVPGEGNKAGKNNLQFNVTGKNGLSHVVSKYVSYEPGCPDWHVGKIESYPFNIYTRELTQDDIQASAFFPIEYLGSGTPKVTNLNVRKDDSNSAYLMAGEDEMSELFEVANGGKASMYDEENGELYVYVPITIKKYRGSIKKLPEQLNAYLPVHMTYSVDGEGTTPCEIYPVVAFDIQKPELVTQWLSPTMINNTIKMLDKAITNTKKIIANLKTASIIGLIACGAMIAYHYIQGFFGMGGEEGEDGCTDTQDTMEYTYWVCDRILCPSVPPDCNEFTQIPGAENRFQANLEDATWQIEYMPVDDKGIVEGDKTRYTLNDKGDNILLIDRQFKTEAAKCKDGTLIVVSRTNISGKAGVYQVGEKSEMVEVRCDKRNISEIGDPSVKNMKGCYKEQCPYYDHTKCFTTAGIEPPGGLWSSARCVCLPGLMSHLRNWLKVMMGAKKCLEQALIGEVRGGYCERLLAQFICDLLIEAFKFALSWAESSGGTGDTGVRGALGDYKKNSDTLSNDLSNRYGDVVKDNIELSSDRLVNKFCVVAFTLDWSLLDAVLENIVEEVEVEPIAYLEAESRPYGYDPFTGKMSIGYNVYTGIVAGGETDVKTWLECDRNFPGGEYCGSGADPIKISEATRHMTKNDPPLNRNIVWTQRDSLWWYNKAVMELRYEISGKPQTKTLTKQIWRKGDLVASCYFSVIGGIHCKGLTEYSPNGIVELYSANQGTHLTPKGVPRYQDGDQVAALVKLRNAFMETFFLIVQYDDKPNDPIEYAIPGAGETRDGWAELQTYILWLDTASVSGSGGTSAIDDTWTFTKEHDRDTSDYIAVQIDDTYLTDLEALILPKVDPPKEAKSFTCKIPSPSTMNDPNQDRYYNYGRYSNGVFETGTSDNRYVDGYYLCVIPEDDFGSYIGSEIKGVSKITLKNPGWKANMKQDFVSMPIRFKGFKDLTEYTLKKQETGGGTRSGTKKVKINVYQDTDGDGAHGDSPIVMAGSTGDQTVELTYQIGTTTDTKPRVELVEPTGNKVNKDDKPIPIGMTVWNVKDLTVTIKSRNGKVDCQFGIGGNKDCKSGDIKVESGRSTKGDSGKPPFYEYYVTFKGDFPSAPTDTYDIKITTQHNGKEIELDSFTFQFDKTGKVTQESLMVCLGSGTCSSGWGNYQDASDELGSYADVGMPTVRSG